jgi:hypothetical protein
MKIKNLICSNCNSKMSYIAVEGMIYLRYCQKCNCTERDYRALDIAFNLWHSKK